MLAEYEGKCVVLYTSYVSNQLFEVDWRKLNTTLHGKKARTAHAQLAAARRRTILVARAQVDFIEFDGAAKENKEKRSAFFAIAGVGVKYPLVFLDNQYVGGMNEIQEMLEVGKFEGKFAKYIAG